MSRGLLRVLVRGRYWEYAIVLVMNRLISFRPWMRPFIKWLADRTCVKMSNNAMDVTRRSLAIIDRHTKE